MKQERNVLTMLITVVMAMSSFAAEAQTNGADDSRNILTDKNVSISKKLKQQRLNHWHIPAANYSGLTAINDNQYAVCDDKAACDGFTLLTIKQNPKTGKIIDIEQSVPSAFAQRQKDGTGRYRDCEGIVFCPERNTVFVSGEEDQRIVEYDLDGEPTGHELAVPEEFSTTHIRKNYGFEALTYNSHTGLFWTTTESTLKQDGESATLAQRDVANVLRLQSFNTSLQPREQYRYTMDLPTVTGTEGTYIHGVPSLLALDDGSLVVMEREEFVPRGYIGAFCKIKLYVVDPKQATDKRLLTEFTTHLRPRKMNLANYEGMCLGRTLEDGRPTLLLICDSQAGQGNRLFHLKDYIRVITLK